MNIASRGRLQERGGVSIFIVIFTALLVTVVTASFTQLMVRGQQQATANDLSQSAYDSAIAGVEDAKRALVRFQECENEGTSAGDTCADSIKTALEKKTCNSLESAGVVRFSSEGEVQVGEPEQNQAYTCVIVDLETPTVEGEGLKSNVPTLIPLRSKQDIDTVKISWFTSKDLGKLGADDSQQPDFPTPSDPTLERFALGNDWPSFAPPLLRAQLIQFKKGGLSLDSFNSPGSANARTLFLYPSDSGGSASDFGLDFRRSGSQKNIPKKASCNRNFTTYGGYACQVEISLPNPENGSKVNREAYLELQTYYQDVSSYKVELGNGSGTPPKFDQVQAIVDSTGRASSLFRRVKVNISLRNDGVPQQAPSTSLYIDGDLCKNFFVTDEAKYAGERGDAGCQ